MPLNISRVLHALVPHSLHARLVIGISLGWLVLVAAIILVASRSGDQLAGQANRAHLEYEAELIARHIEEAVAVRVDALQRLAERVPQAPEQSVALLDENVGLMALFDALVMISADGEVLADIPELPGRRGLDVSEREYFRYMRHVRRPYVSEPFTGAASDAPLVMVAVPILAEGEFRGMLGGVVNVEDGSFFAGLRRIRIGHAGFAALATASGLVLSHPSHELVMRPVPGAATHPELDLALSGWEGAAAGRLVDGTPALQAYRQVWSANWVVGVYLPRTQVMGPVKAFLRQQQWVGVITVLLMLPLLWLGLKLLLRPLHRLERHIAKVARGAAKRVDPRTGMRELQRVADTFNSLEQQREQAKALLQDRQAFLDAVLDSSPTGLFICNLRGQIVYLNPALHNLTGYDLEDYRDWQILEHLHVDEIDDVRDLWRHTLETGRPFSRQMRYHAANGQMLWLEVNVSRVADDGKPLGYVGTVKDITDSRQREALQRWEAEHDPLTGLLNRRGFERRLEEALVEWKKAGTPSALLMFDLDHFKPINDRGGHALGDEMLRRIAQVLAWEVRNSDHVARQGGDEFAVLLPSCSLNQAQRLAEKLRQAISEIYVEHEDSTYHVTMSMGLTGLLESDEDIETVLARADAASYRAKAAGRDAIVQT
ncbi:sensor domain-containing diguanylate cyclase [Halomonas salipaludis]|uniref:Diguanylate cyclase n=1 Tax=Halomonas salipaludis TaxID=2032625 RepID=A0A2A2EWI8_9GAMM|nr:diguanylate cyclase [Halomonas salipaludis]PAU76643.1 diguanylate cyclase [Halomonas salipaludis]